MLLRAGSLCKGLSTIISIKTVVFSLMKYELNVLPFYLVFFCCSTIPHNCFCSYVVAASSQILELTEEPRDLPPKFNEVYHQLALPTLPLHCCLCSAGHAALWRTVSDLPCPTYRYTSLLSSFPCPSPAPVCALWPIVAALTDLSAQQVAGTAVQLAVAL